MAIIDPTKTWVPVEERLAVTTNERHRQVLSIVLEHMKAEAEPDMERLMATLAPNPDYHFWYANADMGPRPPRECVPTTRHSSPAVPTTSFSRSIALPSTMIW